ncbi:MAG: hypothetical protein KDC66_08925 [Phaeodactylibacter sp.]|nr:hypothetical protein [Phaeodactylibacter sp.]MCB9276197.1 phosphatidylcholine/phosphatidylserine synthase [Lewinellaceae bacterium]
MRESETRPGLASRLAAWGVHLFTASGVITVFMALLAVSKGSLREAMLWLVAAQFIDGVDGTLARRFRVTEVLPYMNGKNIDFVIDFASYAIIPAYMIYASGLIGGWWNLACALLILMVSAVYYGKEGMVSEDHYFVGFPVMWNMAAFYMLFVFQWGHWANVILVAALSILHFVPIKFAYPSRTLRWRWLSLGLTGAGILAALGILYYYPERKPLFNAFVNLVLLYFGAFALWVTFSRPADKR